jgi:WD40 repeat protein
MNLSHIQKKRCNIDHTTNIYNKRYNDYSTECILIHENVIFAGYNDSTIRIWKSNEFISNEFISNEFILNKSILQNNVYKCIKILHGHKSSISKIIIYDNLLVSLARDNCIRFWSLLTYNCIDEIKIYNIVGYFLVDLVTNISNKIIACCSVNQIFIINKNKNKFIITHTLDTFLKDIDHIGILENNSIICNQEKHLYFYEFKDNYKSKTILDVKHKYITRLAVYNDIIITGYTHIHIWEKDKENNYVATQILLKDNCFSIYELVMHEDIIICGVANGLVYIFRKLKNEYVLNKTFKSDIKKYIQKYASDAVTSNQITSLAYNEIKQEVVVGHSLDRNLKLFY